MDTIMVVYHILSEHSCPTNGAMFTQLDLSTVSRISTGMDIYCFLSQTLTSTSHIGLDSVSASYQQWFVDTLHTCCPALKFLWGGPQSPCSHHPIPQTQLTLVGMMGSDSGSVGSLCPLSRPPFEPSARKKQPSCPEDLILPACRHCCRFLLMPSPRPEEAFSSFPGRQPV